MRQAFLFFLCISTSVMAYAQDTFSIVAIDTITREVGSAGASCVDLFRVNLPDADFIAHVLPSIGAINTQANYSPVNQIGGTVKLLSGERPDRILGWLQENDVTQQPQLRQYGIAVLRGERKTAAFTGLQTDGYQGHLLGATYAIQGNLLTGQNVLDSMEARFLRETGDLACKLMAALLGAKDAGGDRRCQFNGTSSLFAFINVAQPTDTFGSSSLDQTVRTHFGEQVEPVDSLFRIFENNHWCEDTD
ncbi:MAG: DUF1028 domain-containing protein [Flavobacteriales bacterium]|nr:DUF1028 domain-containing protein [Flavobacteriales bacterium]